MKPIEVRICVGAVIVKDRKVLIVQRVADEEAYPNLWELPSGRKEPLESLEDGLRREVSEETGLEIMINELIMAFQYSYDSKGTIKDVTELVYRSDWISGEVKISSEHQNYAWITLDELENYNISKETKEAITLALS